MTYATKQLTDALQELTAADQPFNSRVSRNVPPVINANELQFSQEVEAFLVQQRDYAEKTRCINVGTY